MATTQIENFPTVADLEKTSIVEKGDILARMSPGDLATLAERKIAQWRKLAEKPRWQVISDMDAHEQEVYQLAGEVSVISYHFMENHEL